MSGMLRDKTTFKVILGASVLAVGAAGAVVYLRKKGPCSVSGTSTTTSTTSSSCSKSAAEPDSDNNKKDEKPAEFASVPPAAERQASTDHGEETVKTPQRISIQIPPPNDSASTGSQSPDNLSLSDTFEKVSPSQLASLSNTPPGPPTPPRVADNQPDSLAESFGSAALGESFEQVSLGSQLREAEGAAKESVKEAKAEETPKSAEPSRSESAVQPEFNASVTSPVFGEGESAKKSSTSETTEQISSYDASTTHPASVGYKMQ